VELKPGDKDKQPVAPSGRVGSNPTPGATLLGSNPFLLLLLNPQNIP